jgi:hypothetical protein
MGGYVGVAHVERVSDKPMRFAHRQNDIALRGNARDRGSGTAHANWAGIACLPVRRDWHALIR